jgi:16S rRNA (adenine1518-N6/adenine1519-N6)-dimethyltransferase
MKVKKSLGQHFLKSEKALRSIIEAGEIIEKDIVLEIGPGQGALTEKLLKTGARVVAIEKDDNLFEQLKKKFKNEINSGQLDLIHADILDLDISYYLLPTTDYKLVANIPYNITGAILKKFLGADCQPKRIVLLVQKEVAQRIVGNRGRKASTKESILSISVKAYGTPRYVETVKAGSFAPAPKVDSAIIVIDGISKDFFNCGSKASTITEREFFEIVRAGFRSKRKKLSSNLSQIVEKDKVKEAFESVELDPNTRAEDVSVDNWQKLAQNLVII